MGRKNTLVDAQADTEAGVDSDKYSDFSGPQTPFRTCYDEPLIVRRSGLRVPTATRRTGKIESPIPNPVSSRRPLRLLHTSRPEGLKHASPNQRLQSVRLMRTQSVPRPRIIESPSKHLARCALCCKAGEALRGPVACPAQLLALKVWV